MSQRGRPGYDTRGGQNKYLGRLDQHLMFLNVTRAIISLLHLHLWGNQHFHLFFVVIYSYQKRTSQFGYLFNTHNAMAN